MLRRRHPRENIDGEALLWARGRLLSRTGRRKIADGDLRRRAGRLIRSVSEPRQLPPSATCATSSTGSDALAVELIAIGIGRDVTRYYRRAVTIVDADQLGGTMISSPRCSTRGHKEMRAARGVRVSRATRCRQRQVGPGAPPTGQNITRRARGRRQLSPLRFLL